MGHALILVSGSVLHRVASNETRTRVTEGFA
jgi:hypothetical protein